MSEDEHVQNSGFEHLTMRDATDVRCGYALFLLRLPDSEDHISGWVGKNLKDMASAFLNSAEFNFRLAPKLSAAPASQPTFGIIPGDVSIHFRHALKRFCGLEPSAAITGMSGWRWSLFWLCTLPQIRDVTSKVLLGEGSLIKALCEHVTWDVYGSAQDERRSAVMWEGLDRNVPQMGTISKLDPFGITGQIEGYHDPSTIEIRANVFKSELWPIFFEREAYGDPLSKGAYLTTRFVILFEHPITAHALERGLESEIRLRLRGQTATDQTALLIVVCSHAQTDGDQVIGFVTAPPEAQSLTFWAKLADIDYEDEEASISRAALSASQAHWSASTGLPKLIAFYLPQFYPFSENDQAWGEGFTEWTNVVSAPKLFPDHNSPLLPADLGFYDLRSREVRKRQAELALQNGINGFCYYFYWFNGRQVMGDVLQRILRDGQPSLPFCLCWANENWSRRWDGSENETIISQTHDAHVDAAIIDDLARFFDDPRYIRINGAPLFLVYHLSLMAEPAQFVVNLRARAKALGYPHLALAGVLSHNEPDPVPWGCDFGVQFPPHEMGARQINPETLGAVSDFSGEIYDYATAGEVALSQKRSVKVLPGVMPRWDNSARRGHNAHLFHGASPTVFKHWLRAAIAKTCKENPEAPLVFINSWNEWAEGAVLEPDRYSGRAYLNAVREAVNTPLLPVNNEVDPAMTSPQIAALINENRFLGSWLSSFMPLLKSGPLRVGLPPVCGHLSIKAGFKCQLHSVDGIEQSIVPPMPLGTSCILAGACLGDYGLPSLYQYLLIETLDGAQNWFLPCASILPPDIAYTKLLKSEAQRGGFQVGLSTEGLQIGTYQLSVLDVTEETCYKSLLVAAFELTGRP